MPIMTITAAIAGLKNTIDIAKAAVAARDELKLAEMQQSINDRVIDVQNAALALQEKQSAARDEIDRLKDELRETAAKLAEVEKKRTDRAQYVLHELTTGVFVLASTMSDATGHPAHFICQPCMDNKAHKAVLQQTGTLGTIKLKCPECSTEYRTGEHVRRPPMRISGAGY
ncbi:SlyX family protein [Burkholderia sp. LS-044]|uniref:SlyX family protein n=1 Tax=Burkholderia sp. LS-044 TaxID=1459967 RepID=UPI0010A673DD|nr:SlyX family protein [Burkholderia sp. LS-044]THJ52574.1 SlyX family protein [Burkholderia sp. LS-044]